MRIALMTNNYKPIVAGVPISIERLAKGLEELGHEVTIFAPTYKERQTSLQAGGLRGSGVSRQFTHRQAPKGAGRRKMYSAIPHA